MHYKFILRGAMALLLLLTLAATAVAQQTISGVLLDEQTGDPLIGASVLLKGTSSGTVTDVDGSFSLQASDGDVLIFSYTGYQNREITVGPGVNYNLSLTSGELLDEVVVVAYGKQKKATVTGAVVGVQGGALQQSPSVNLGASLAGRLPGVVVIQPSGEPGNDNALINIRGVNTLGNSSPLIVIDGVPDRAGGLARLSPQDIESISVLKDASAAIYGARAANGAILVTTKRGVSGKPTVSYDFNQGWAQPTVIPEMASAVEYANIMNELPIYQTVPVNEWSAASQAIRTSGTYDSPTPGVGTINANFSPEAVRLHGAGTDPWGFPDSDWFGDAFRTWAPQSQHNLSVRGGTQAVRYFASAGFVNQEAFYKNTATKYKQYNLRINLDADISQYITTSIGITARREDRRYPTQDANAIFRMLMRGRPTEPGVWPNGLPGPDIENGQNPNVITTNATGYVDSPTDYLQANGSVTLTNPWIKGLSLTFSGAADNSNNTTKRWETPWTLYFWDRVSFEPDGVTPLLEGAVRSNFTDPRLRQSNFSTLNTNLSTRIDYNTQFGAGHNIGLMAGVTRETFSGEGFQAFRRNYISAAVDQLFAGGSLQQETGGSGYNRARLGYYGRAQYDYNEKYLLEFIFRYDGSYIFPESDRFGFFPGVLAGWNISNEDFFNVGAVDLLKIRASYGQMGNDQVFFNNQLQEFAYLSTYGFGEYPINSVVETTLREIRLANPSFTWERANNLNFGIDAILFNNRVDATLEYFVNKRDQILIQETGSTPASSGINSLLPPVNAGEVENRGFEFNLGYNGRAGKPFQWRFGVNGGYAKNKVIFMDEIPGAPDYQLMEGKPIGAYLVYESDGVFRDQAEINAETLDYSAVTGRLLPGDMKFRDVNGDGKIDGDDRVRIDDNGTPTFNFGANFTASYKGLDITALLQGATGASLRVQTESGDIGNYLKWSHDNRWSIDNPSSEHPRLASRGDTYYTGGNYGQNTYWLFSKNYLRLKNLEIGYTLPTALTSRLSLGSLRAYVNGLNLLTFDSLDFFDPESTAGSGVYYPQTRIINLGLNVTF
ncbi:TonB-dependent receptor [Neolewinella lacunae]|uniref:TonB-dependent receptor n=1 Tax=Neolewinella lacunae TaxID=1517758 RepID=A0A923PSN7_9BACT|nr:TonB-dependent receptor [Neolewinella lacunae]MBC6996067.1 TonB-dependent receptor [Neolewinella lacunae]MDN3636813.1 TonB-dependent receptor [Neolewinella lacunae]